MATGYDPVTKLKDAPNNPKERYKIMTNEMPKGGELSLNMMYQTSGTQVNMDYSSEEDFKKKFKLMCYLTPLAHWHICQFSCIRKQSKWLFILSCKSLAKYRKSRSTENIFRKHGF